MGDANLKVYNYIKISSHDAIVETNVMIPKNVVYYKNNESSVYPKELDHVDKHLVYNSVAW